MSYRKPAVCASVQDGLCHAALMDLLGSSIEWVAEQPDGSVTIRPFALGGPAHDIKIAVDGQGRRWAVTSEGGAAVLYDVDANTRRVIVPTGIGAGFANIHALPAGCDVLVAQMGGNVAVFNTHGQAVALRPMAYASEGIHHVEPDGTCISEDQARGPIDAPFGAKLYRVETHDGRTLGQLSDLIEGVGLLATGELFQVSGVGYNDQSSHFVVSQITGRPWIAVPGENTPAPHLAALEPVPPPVSDPVLPPPVEPPVTPPPVEPPPVVPPPVTPPVPPPPSVPPVPPATPPASGFTPGQKQTADEIRQTVDETDRILGRK